MSRRTDEQRKADDALTEAVLGVVRAYWDDTSLDEETEDHEKPQVVLDYAIVVHSRSMQNVDDNTSSYSYLFMNGPDGQPQHHSKGLVQMLWEQVQANG